MNCPILSGHCGIKPVCCFPGFLKVRLRLRRLGRQLLEDVLGCPFGGRSVCNLITNRLQLAPATFVRLLVGEPTDEMLGDLW